MDRIVQDKLNEIPYLEPYRNSNKIVRSRFREIFSDGHIALIGEVKPASPVKGKFRSKDDIESTIKELSRTKISAISVLTDSHFNASIDNINLVRKYVSVPILRKDFIIDELQVFESSYYEVDALLLIARILNKRTLNHLYNLSVSLGIEPIVEVYSLEDLDMTLELNPSIILINNRNLETFEVDIRHTEELKRYIPYSIRIISASGISTKEDIKYLKDLGVDAVLIGEAIMKASNIGEKIAELMDLED